jgi:hypothetical protein
VTLSFLGILALLLLYLGISGTVFWTALRGGAGERHRLGNARPPLSVYDREFDVPDYVPREWCEKEAA